MNGSVVGASVGQADAAWSPGSGVPSGASRDEVIVLDLAARVRLRLDREADGDLWSVETVERVAKEELRRYCERALAGRELPLMDERAALRRLLAELGGLGPLQPWLDDPSVEEVWINAPDAIFVARSGVSERIPVTLTEQQVRDLVERMLHASGRRVDRSSPFVDASLEDGSRLHVVLPDITRRHISVNIRKFNASLRSLVDLQALGSMTDEAANLLTEAVRSGQSILVSGATQAGKTTMLNALLAAVPAGQRVVSVEETFELHLPGEDSVAMQCRQASLEGSGEVTLRRLVKEALRMRPDRIIVGEVREAESLDLLIAMNSGLPAMCSIHANSARDALRKLCTLPLLAGGNISTTFTVPTVTDTIGLVVHCVRRADGSRHVVEIAAPVRVTDLADLAVVTKYQASAQPGAVRTTARGAVSP